MSLPEACVFLLQKSHCPPPNFEAGKIQVKMNIKGNLGVMTG